MKSRTRDNVVMVRIDDDSLYRDELSECREGLLS